MRVLVKKAGAVTSFAFLLLLAGCGDSKVVKVSGTLTYKGKPVTNAILNFVPVTGRPSIGETDKNGNFTLTYDPQTKGAEKGTHRVFVMRNQLAETTAADAIPGMPIKLPPDMTEFFSKYGGDNSKVTVTIDKSVGDLKLEWD